LRIIYLKLEQKKIPTFAQKSWDLSLQNNLKPRPRRFISEKANGRSPGLGLQTYLSHLPIAGGN
jgi:hypothetical protein